MRPLIVAACLLLTACAGTTVLNTLTPERGYTVATNQPYDGEHGLRLDIYTPDDAQAAPVVVFFYGGRWSEGSKDDYKFVGQALASRGFVAVLADYRLYPDVRFPTFVEDAARAVAWTRQRIDGFGGDPDKMFVMGHSAGAHIAAMLALNPAYLEAVALKPDALKGMIGLAGAYDFLPITAPDLRDIFGPPEAFQKSQPIFFANGRNPPLLLVHGEDDEAVWVKNTRNLAKAVAQAGGAVETVIYPKMSHRFIVATLAAPLRGQSDVLDTVAEFVNRRAAAAPRRDGPEIETTPIYLP